MSAETPALGRGSVTRSKVKTKSTPREGQSVRAFNPERYGAMSVATLQLLPESNARAFAIGFALGTSLDGAGTSDSVRNGKQVSGSLITRDRLPDVLEALGNPDPSQWRRYVREWIARYVAHRCSPGVVCLFRLPYLSECPACGAEIAIEAAPEPSRKPRGPGFKARGSITPVRATGAELPPRGSIAPVPRNKHSRGPEQTLPPLSTTANHRVSGINGMGVGGGPCSGCGALSESPGYHGHAMSCPAYWRSEVVGA
jgi:hypothetical protein